MSFRVINGKAYAIGNFNLPTQNESLKISSIKTSFDEILKEKISEKSYEYNLSNHAANRLKEINFNQEDMKNIGKGFEIAENKGSKNTAIIYKDVTLIASVENKTLITAVERERSKENIFTNIDSVVIL